MCGIVGYTGGEQKNSYFLFEGLKRLEYRGYDSVGLSYFLNHKNKKFKDQGSISKFIEKHPGLLNDSHNSGIGHTRWATHGIPSKENAHPHQSSIGGNLHIIHNGIIENYMQLYESIKPFCDINTENDTAILVNYIEYSLKSKALSLTLLTQILEGVQGSYALVIIDQRNPQTLFVARKNNPILIGKKEGNWFVSSDMTAFAGIVPESFYMHDDSCIALCANKPAKGLFLNGKTMDDFKFSAVDLNPEVVSKGKYEDFMIKEIYEQKQQLFQGVGQRIKGEKIVFQELSPQSIEKIKRSKHFSYWACGTSYHASKIGSSFIKELCAVNAYHSLASEYSFSFQFHQQDEVAIFVSQSGETADALAALRKIKERGVYTLAVCNVLGSTLAREADDVIYIHAGPEISVASTKAFNAQLITLRLLAIFVSQLKNESKIGGEKIQEILSLKEYLAHIFDHQEVIKNKAQEIAHCQKLLYLGRGDAYSLALEAALKMKEISYIFCFAVAAGEMKHGTLALVDQHLYSIFISFNPAYFYKLENSVKEVISRGGKVILFVPENYPKERLRDENISFLCFPTSSLFHMLIGCTIYLQMFAYFTAKHLGRNIDQPRNLAKSVTVE